MLFYSSFFHNTKPAHFQIPDVLLFTLKHLGSDVVLSLQRGKLVKDGSSSQLTSCTVLASSKSISKEEGGGRGAVDGNEKGANFMFCCTVLSKVTND